MMMAQPPNFIVELTFVYPQARNHFVRRVSAPNSLAAIATALATIPNQNPQRLVHASYQKIR